MPTPRRLQPEWLDELPADDPRAMRSRRDLMRVNGWMMQPGIMARALRTHHYTPRTIVDIGSGDGTFMLRVARKLAREWRGVCVVMLDRQNIVSAKTRNAFEALGWRCEPITGDLF